MDEETRKYRNQLKNMLIALGLFLVILVVGQAVVEILQTDYIVAALLYLAAVVGAGLFWIGRDRE